MPDSDPYDVDDFNLDDHDLDKIDNIEAIFTASQAPRQSLPATSNAVAGSSKHHTIAPPRSNGLHASNSTSSSNVGKPGHSVGGMAPAPFGRTKAGKPRAPAPLNTTPGVTGTGFGWEHGGKRSMDGNLQRNLEAIEERQTYWYGSSQQQQDQGQAPLQAHGAVNGQAYGQGQGQASSTRRGHFRMPSMGPPITPIEEEGRILDTHDAHTSDSYQQMPAPAIVPNRNTRAMSEEAKAARRAAIRDANASVSTSSATLSTTMQAPRPMPAVHRTFSRSASTGSNILHRPPPMAGPSRLSPIPDLSSSQTSSQQSAGAALRRKQLQLDEAEKREQALMQRLADLEARAKAQEQAQAQAQAQAQNAAAGPSSQRQRQSGQDEADGAGDLQLPTATQAAWTANLPVDVNLSDTAAVAKKIKELQMAYYTARGAETNIRKQLKDTVDKHKAKEERWEAAQQEMNHRITQQQKDEKVKLEQLRTEAIFNNHAAHATASKSRSTRAESSQRPNQRHDLRTPMPASPSRRGQDDARQLISSSKGKGKAAAPLPPAQPSFRNFQNAFDAPPTGRKPLARASANVGANRGDRSGTASPVKRSPSRMQSVKREPDDDGDGDVDMDVDGGYDDRDDTAGSAAVPVVVRTPKKSASQSSKVGGVFGGANGEVEEGGEEGDASREEEEVEVEEQLAEVPKRDDRSAFLHTLVSHNRPTSLHLHTSRFLIHLTTLRRILAYQAPSDKDSAISAAYPNDKIVWNDTTSALLGTLGEGEVSAERLIARTARHLGALNEWMLRRVMLVKSVTEQDLCVILDLFRLMTALARLFPSFATEIIEHNAHDRGRSCGSWGMLCLELYTTDELSQQIRDIYAKMQANVDASAAEARGISAQGVSGTAQQRQSSDAAGEGIISKKEKERAEAEEKADMADWCTQELGCTIADLGAALYLYADGDEASESLLDIMMCLTERQQHPSVIRRACDMFHAAATYSSHFRVLTMERPETKSLINRLAHYLASKQRRGAPEELLSADIAIVRGLCMLALSDPSAIAIISERSFIVPSLIQVLDHEVRKVWGLNVRGDSVVHAALLIYPAIMLLHMFVNPPPFSRTYSSFSSAYNQPSYPSLTETVYPDPRSEKAHVIRQPITINRDIDTVKSERSAFLAAQELILSALPDSEIPAARQPGNASQSIAFAHGSDIPQPLRIKQKLSDWSRQAEMRHVRHSFIAALAPAAYDELSEDMFVPSLEDEEERARMKRRGVGAREVFEMLRFTQLLAGNILEVVYQDPSEVDGLWDLFNAEQSELDMQMGIMDQQAGEADGDDVGAIGGADQGDGMDGEGERGVSPTTYTKGDGHAGPSRANGNGDGNGNGNGIGHAQANGYGGNSQNPRSGKSPRKPSAGRASQRARGGARSQVPKGVEVIQVSDDSEDGW